MKCLGLDIGYGDTKAFDGARVISFPTAVSMAIYDGGFSAKTCVCVDNEKFYAGDDVKGEASWFDTRTSDFVGSSPWVAVLGKAIRDCGFNTFRNSLVMGMPAAQYNKEASEELVHVLKQKYITVGNGSRIDLSNTYIDIVPQGFGIFLKYVSDTKINYKKSRIAVADIGYHTIDLITMYEGVYLNDYAQSYPLGVSVLLDTIAKAFCSKYRFFISRKRAMDFIGNGRVEWLGEKYEVDEIQSVLEKYAAHVATVINNYMEGQEPDIGLAGGGGVYILSKMVKLKKRLALVDVPESANAVGYWHYGILRQAE
jgi:hypothetical protein